MPETDASGGKSILGCYMRLGDRVWYVFAGTQPRVATVIGFGEAPDTLHLAAYRPSMTDSPVVGIWGAPFSSHFKEKHWTFR